MTFCLIKHIIILGSRDKKDLNEERNTIIDTELECQ